MLTPKAFFTLLCLLIFLGSCKINRFKNNLRTGLWITEHDKEEGFRSRGRYKKDKEKGVWKFYYNDTLYQKDRYSGNKARVKFYHPNKKLRSSGRTQMDYNGKLLHWYYNGDWKYFDAHGKLIKVVTYLKGDSITEVSQSQGKKLKE